MAKNCYVLIKGFDRNTKKMVANKLFESFNEISPYITGIKKKESGFTIDYRSFRKREGAQSFLDSIKENKQMKKSQKPHSMVATIKKEKKAVKNIAPVSESKEESKAKDLLIANILSTPLVKQISEEFIHIFVDGSYDSNRKIGGGGIVFVKNNMILIRDFIRCTYDTTNALSSVVMERLTVKRAVELAIASVFTHSFYRKIMSELSSSDTPLYYLNGQCNMEKSIVEIYKTLTNN